jgi:hypothetical protein
MRSWLSSCIGSKRPSSKYHPVEKPPANCTLTALPHVNPQTLLGFLVQLHSELQPRTRCHVPHDTGLLL